VEKRLLRRMQQKVRASNASNHAADGERNHDAPRNIKMLAIRACARRDSNPKRNRVGGVRGNGSDSAEHQRRKGDETSASSNGIQRSAKRPSKKQEEDGLNRQISGLSQSEEVRG